MMNLANEQLAREAAIKAREKAHIQLLGQPLWAKQKKEETSRQYQRFLEVNYKRGDSDSEEEEAKKVCAELKR